MQLFSTFASLLLCLSLVSQSVGRGLITSPANGTAIKPGQSFNFSYEAHTDYCVSSFNYTVWLLTTNPATARLGLDNVFGYGRFLGRFAQESYPTNPYPTNPPPPQLVMPDFSQSFGGFDPRGQTASNLPVYLAVIEEWSTCEPALAERLSLMYNTLVYNSTKTK